MSTVQHVVIALAGRTPDPAVRAEALRVCHLSVHIGTLVAYIPDQRVIREMHRTLADAHRLAQVQKLPTQALKVDPGPGQAASVVHFGRTLATRTFFDDSDADRPRIRIETPPVIWLVFDLIALDQLSQVWATARVLSQHLPGGFNTDRPRLAATMRNWARRQGMPLQDFEADAVLQLARGEDVPWLQRLPGTRPNQLRELASLHARMRTAHGTSEAKVFGLQTRPPKPNPDRQASAKP